jgi:hypothetical protein
MAQKPASPDEIMSTSELKPVLRAVKSDGGAEVSCAVAMTEDREAVILVHKKDKPKRVQANLTKKAKDVGLALNKSSIRFGRATLDPQDETVLLIKVNREPAGGAFQTSIKKRLKLAGFADIVFTVDEGLESEGEEDAGQPTQGSEVKLPSVDQLRASMQKLVPAIKSAIEAHPELKEALLAASKSFMSLLGANDLAGAAHSLEDTVRLLKQAAAEPGKPTADVATARTELVDAMHTVESQLSKLADGLFATNVSELSEIAEFGLSAVTGNYRVPMMAALMALGPATPETLAKSGDKAIAAVQAFRKHIDTDERVAACERNPLGVPVTIRTTLGPALDALEAAIAQAKR